MASHNRGMVRARVRELVLHPIGLALLVELLVPIVLHAAIGAL